jgi:hypothetical protein
LALTEHGPDDYAALRRMSEEAGVELTRAAGVELTRAA